MLLFSTVYRVAVTAFLICIGLALPFAGTAQNCLDYSETLHWSNAVETTGLAEAVALDGNLGYTANGSDDGDGGSISILDMTILRAPQILSTLYTPGFALDIDEEAGVICVADGSCGLTIVEAANPADPSIIGRLEDLGFVQCVALTGSIALVGSHALYAVDVASPASPVILDQIEAPGCSQIVIEGTRAYVSSNCCGFRIFDIEDPGDLRLLGSFDVTCRTSGLAVSLPYVTFAGSTYGFGVIDVSDPAAPFQVGWSPEPEYAQGAAVCGGRAYVVDGRGLTLFDIEDPAAPIMLGYVPLSESPHSVTLAGGYAFVSSGYAGVQIVNIEHDWPAEPLGELAPLDHTKDVAACGGFAYLAEGTAGLAVVDLADPALPVVVGTASLPNSTSARNVAVEGSRSCIIDYTRQLHTFDVSEPSEPVLLSSTLLPESPYSLILAGGWAFIPCGGNGLVLIDISGSRGPQTMWVYDTPGWALDIAVQGHLAYVVDSYALMILDVTNPPKPKLVGQWNQAADEISVDGDYACLSNGYGGLFLLDIRDPANPFQVAECDLPSYTLTATLSWPYVYSSNAEGGLVIHRVDDPGGFTFAGSYDLPRNTGTVTREGDLLLVPLWDEGLQILRPQCGDAAAAPAGAGWNAPVAFRAPNPFSAPGVIRLELRRPADVTLSIFDASGRCITTLADRAYPAGKAEIIWNGKDRRGSAVKPGVYFMSCRTSEGTSTAKLILVR
ncbi:MAG: T9SS type A sorting domain-containing protein [Candidatus Eisenbacteria bacterium]|uniref:T9SS type A sorting domain-containing protein n=1 Tax=Eiseniibacteriota bacterium TaxID=2212470 RepID=A0A948RVQ5_UNCEI|nr:T9SS type A sorting domain-containing protein [Candidatus Eisenbacteria bacterium]MBU1947912.1 T9SS type A sorting domain-containing protein [Candidatus Eisenbacteria bacterium]MBU2691910.1 T9SS type A sorting domain-containing protein [Candidatus Eisenbacteria bacterium]